MDRMRKFIPVAYATKLEPGKGRTRHRSRRPGSMPIDYLVLANKKVPDDVVYKLAKIMHDNKADLAANFGALNGFDPNRMAKDMGPAQFHPGAIKYYKEIGAVAAEERQAESRRALSAGPVRVRRNASSRRRARNRWVPAG